jgi:hypothetical protein
MDMLARFESIPTIYTPDARHLCGAPKPLSCSTLEASNSSTSLASSNDPILQMLISLPLLSGVYPQPAKLPQRPGHFPACAFLGSLALCRARPCAQLTQLLPALVPARSSSWRPVELSHATSHGRRLASCSPRPGPYSSSPSRAPLPWPRPQLVFPSTPRYSSLLGSLPAISHGTQLLLLHLPLVLAALAGRFTVGALLFKLLAIVPDPPWLRRARSVAPRRAEFASARSSPSSMVGSLCLGPSFQRALSLLATDAGRRAARLLSLLGLVLSRVTSCLPAHPLILLGFNLHRIGDLAGCRCSSSCRVCSSPGSVQPRPCCRPHLLPMSRLAHLVFDESPK